MYSLSEREYSFVFVLSAFSLSIVAVTAALFPNPFFRPNGISLVSVGIVFAYLPAFVIVGFFYASKNATNPFSATDTDRRPLYLFIAGILLYGGITAGIYQGYLFLGYLDILAAIPMYIACGKVGGRMFRRSWLSSEIETPEKTD